MNSLTKKIHIVEDIFTYMINQFRQSIIRKYNIEQLDRYNN